MCRLLALASTKLTEDTIRTLVEAFIESSRHDDYLKKITSDKVYSHDDGWGLIALGLIDNKPTLAHHHSIEPIFEEYSKHILDLFIKRISRYDLLYLILHSRKSSRREPYGLEYTHPFMRISERCAGWFAHNGGADKGELARVLGVNPWLRVDSELLGHYVMNNVFNCVESGNNIDECVRATYNDAKKYVLEGSALNTSLLLLVDSEIHLYVTHYTRNVTSSDRKQYYAIVAYTEDGLSLAGSVTLADYLPPKYRDKIISLEPGIYRVEPSRVFKISPL